MAHLYASRGIMGRHLRKVKAKTTVRAYRHAYTKHTIRHIIAPMHTLTKTVSHLMYTILQYTHVQEHTHVTRRHV